MPKQTNLISLKKTSAEIAEEKKQYEVPSSTHDDYPWGMELSLDHRTLEKLSFQPKATKQKVTITATGYVERISTQEREGKVENSATIQMTDMKIIDGTQKEDKMFPDAG